MTRFTAEAAAKLARGPYVFLKQSGNVKAGQIGLPRGFELVGSGVRGETGGGVGNVGFFAKGNDGTTRGTGIIAIRGTAIKRDWLTNLHIGVTAGPGGTPVHIGFQESFSSFEPQVREFISKNNFQTVHIFGHSLGGALATLTADYVSSNKAASARLYTFGAPRVGLKAFGQQLVSNMGPDGVYRLFHDADPVPWAPAYPFVHVPSRHSYRYPSTFHMSVKAHSMSNYIKSARDMGWSGQSRAMTVGMIRKELKQWLSGSSSGSRTGERTRIVRQLLVMLEEVAATALVFILQTPFAIGFTLIDIIVQVMKLGARAFLKVKQEAEQLGRKIWSHLGHPTPTTVFAQRDDFLTIALQMLLSKLRGELVAALESPA